MYKVVLDTHAVHSPAALKVLQFNNGFSFIQLVYFFEYNFPFSQHLPSIALYPNLHNKQVAAASSLGTKQLVSTPVLEQFPLLIN